MERFFENGSTQPTPVLVAILKVLSKQIGTLPNRISIEGHTDARPYSNDKIYSNWELSSDRANVARRLMQVNGVRANQVSQVRGFADERLRNKKDPFDPANRRISLIVQYLDADKDIPYAPQLASEPEKGKPLPGKGSTDPAKLKDSSKKS